MEYINIIKEYALLLFTKSEWHALIMIILVTSSFTETAKRVLFIRMPKIKKKQYIYGTAFMIGAIAGIVGSFIGKPSISIWFWVVAGSIAGPASNAIHWITLGAIAWKFPKFADALKGKTTNG